MHATRSQRSTKLHTGPVLPAPPLRSFASDNAAGAHPAVLAALSEVNRGHALAYGQDEVTAHCEQRFRELFDADVTTLLTFNGTGANVVALGSLLSGPDAVVCRSGSHIETDEAGAAERLLGAKLIDLPADDGKLDPSQLAAVGGLHGIHHVHPAALSITQSSELGTVYTVEEVAALCAAAHERGMLVHVDGARLANAVASIAGATGEDPTSVLRAMTVGAGVDVLSFGGTKNGGLGAEAVVFFDPELARSRRAEHLRKQLTQLPSKMRFVAAQFLALLTDDLWIELAGHANEMARRLHDEAASIAGVDLAAPPAVNSLFPVLGAPVIEPLREWSFFWDWEPARRQVRWMTAWDTTDDDVAAFAAGVRAVAERAQIQN